MQVHRKERRINGLIGLPKDKQTPLIQYIVKKYLKRQDLHKGVTTPLIERLWKKRMFVFAKVLKIKKFPPIRKKKKEISRIYWHKIRKYLSRIYQSKVALVQEKKRLAKRARYAGLLKRAFIFAHQLKLSILRIKGRRNQRGNILSHA